MESSNKIIVIFFLFFIVSTLYNCEAAQKSAETPAEAGKFKSCFTTCVEECIASGRDRTTCEMGCDNDCTTKEEWDMVSDMIKAASPSPTPTPAN